MSLHTSSADPVPWRAHSLHRSWARWPPYRECGTEGVTGEIFTVEKYGEHLLRQGTKVRIIRGTS